MNSKADIPYFVFWHWNYSPENYEQTLLLSTDLLQIAAFRCECHAKRYLSLRRPPSSSSRLRGLEILKPVRESHSLPSLLGLWSSYPSPGRFIILRHNRLSSPILSTSTSSLHCYVLFFFFFLSNRVYLAKQVITSAAFILLQYNFKHALLGIILLKVNIFSVHSR